MTATKNQQDPEHELTPATCPQCPGGGYDIIAGARRDLLLKQMSEALELFQENGGLDDLLNALHDLVLKGLDTSDLNRTVSIDGSGSLFIGCREITDENEEANIEITVVDQDKKYVVEVKKSRIAPIKIFEIAGCPLLGAGEHPGCNPETCPTIQKARSKTIARD